MRVRAEQAGSTIVVQFGGGRLTVDEDTGDLHELVWAITRRAPRNLVLDLANVRLLDCSGIGQLVELQNRVCAAGGLFSLANVERRQKRLLQMLGLLRVFPVFDSREEAITACWSVRARSGTPRILRLEASRHPSGEANPQPTV